MRNWKFLLTSQIIRGAWLISLDVAHSSGHILETLLSPDVSLSDLSNGILSETKPYQFHAYQAGAMSATDSNPSYDKLPKGSVAAFGISGSLIKYGTMCSYGTEEIAAQMMEAAIHPNIAGAYIKADSGGGSVNAISPVSEAVRKFKSLGKPVLFHPDACYSAMQWIAADGTYTMAQNDISAGFGSIGVMMSFADVAGYYEAKGYKLHTVYAPESDEKNAPYEKALKGDYDAIKTEELSPLAQRFIAHVKNARGSKLSTTDEKMFKGKTYSAVEAVQNGLADGIGNTDDAIGMLFDLIEAQKFVTINN